ncbi:MAG: BamA/TamA family outer membrane protein [Burkholderiaceae bacterium]|nr:BamA/TamA family outer membrane protein [Burkholderiaceae bacterium]
MLAGCAGLFGSNNKSTDPATPAAAASAPRADATTLVIDAPGPLRELLQRNLDLARLATLSAQEELDEVEWLRLVGAAPAQARQLLQTEGYFNAEVDVRRDPGPPPTVHMSVRPGPRVRVMEVTLVVRGALRERADAGDQQALQAIRELHAWWPVPPGGPFRNGEWSAAKTGAAARLRAAGYASATVADSGAEIDADTQEAKLTLALDSGPLFVAGPMRIEGLDKHDEVVVRNLAGFGPGAPLTEATLLDYQDRLRKSGLFDAATVSFDSDPAHAGAAPVTVQVHEVPLQSLTLGLGVSAKTGERVTAEHTHRRIFGYRATLHNKIELGRLREAYEGELSSHPRESFYRKMIGLQLERLRTDLDEVVSQRLRTGRTQDGTRIDRLYFIGFDRSVQTTAVNRRDARAWSLQYHGVWRELDSILLPTRGVSISGQGGVGWAFSNVGDAGAFTLAYARFTGYLPLGQSWYTTGRLEVGQIFKRDSVVIPDALTFRAGGDESVRGYEYRTLAPIDPATGTIIGGNVLGTVSFEIARPIPRYPALWGAVFIDAGNAAENWTEFRAARGYGVGLRWRSPVGPLRVDMAYGEQLRKWRLHLSVGIAF